MMLYPVYIYPRVLVGMCLSLSLLLWVMLGGGGLR